MQELLLNSEHKLQEERRKEGCEGNENGEERKEDTQPIGQPILISFMKCGEERCVYVQITQQIICKVILLDLLHSHF